MNLKNKMHSESKPSSKWTWANQTPKSKLALIGLLVICFGGGLMYLYEEPGKPAEITFCYEHSVYAYQGKDCLDPRTLRIPWAYVDYFENQPNGLFQYGYLKLELAYPGMQPWRSLSLIDRWSAQKITVEIRGVTGLPFPEEYRRIVDGDKLIRMPEPSYELESFLSSNKRFSFLRPIDSKRYIKIDCANDNRPEEHLQKGCSVHAFIPFKFPLQAKVHKASTKLMPPPVIVLNIGYRHKRVLLPHWSNINEELSTLIHSFEMTS
jgi:hypothetical protein